MFRLGVPLVLVVVVVAGAFATRRSRKDGPGPVSAELTQGHRPRSVDLAVDPMSVALDRWVQADLLSDDQRRAIIAHEQALVPSPPRAAAPRRRVPAAAEALGYLGGMLAVIGLLLVVGQYWPDMTTAARLVLSGVASGALVAAGFAAPERVDPAWARLRWFLWLAGTATAALFAGVLTLDGLDVANETVALACAGTVVMVSLALWRGQERPVQQLSALGGGVVTVGASLSLVSTPQVAGVAVWLTGVGLLVVSVRRLVPITPAVTVFVGAVALLAGPVMMLNAWPGAAVLFIVASGLGLLSLAGVVDLVPEHTHRVVLVLLGGFALLQGVPSTLAYYGEQAAGATGLVLWATGAVVLAVGARHLGRWPVPAEVLGGLALLGGAAFTGVQWAGFAPIFGIVTAVGLVGLGTLPGQMLLSVLGSLGLLVNVPWAVGYHFPGEARAPLLIMVTGGLIIAIAVLLTRSGDRFRRDLGASGARPGEA